MNRSNPFQGFGVALATPFNSDGSIDFVALRSLVDNIIVGGVDFICVLGTTAETPTLTEEEKLEIRRVVVEVNQERVPLLLGAGNNSTQAVCRQLREDNFEGFSGLLMVCPFYNKPTQEGLYQHFKKISEESPLPIVLYNIPGRTGVNLQAATTLRLANDCPNIVAIKEASGIITQIEEIVEYAPDGFDVFSGDDAITFELLTIGAKGVISVIGNAYPEEFGAMVHAAQAGDYTSALNQHRQFRRLYKLMSVDGNPSGIKGLLYIQGKADNIVRLPLVPVRVETLEAIRHYAED
ncbi:4-hydroxy-tetrahydrodipicolinate synthase [Alloprevotella tannerae]|uniref:4-hydroxy-tetrahydrodipicolinate synthase n=1 Tax=Alloprevotella tannerae TaxID=76122 RepID=UPI001EDB8CF7|nr:4-hydroxy-tetrahydrodipicolinate synthase [Alloprevotella tannerae]MCG2646063.1 4-hydroxy-tetrahydrodipicolinate synthase [Alloprevotella tannerae]